MKEIIVKVRNSGEVLEQSKFEKDHRKAMENPRATKSKHEALVKWGEGESKASIPAQK